MADKKTAKKKAPAKKVVDKQAESDTVEVPKDVLAKLVERMDSLEEDNKVLRQASDKARLASIEEKSKKELIPKVSISTIDNELVTGWKMTKDEVGFDTQGRQFCKQEVRIFTRSKDGESNEKDMNYIDWIRNSKKIFGEIIKKETGEDGEYYTIKLEDFGEVRIPIQFINT